MELKPVKGLKPFTRFLMTIGELPSSYLVSMTYEEQLLWFCNFLQNTVIPTINNNSEAVIELQEFVSNYFDNLDVQEEINNKLDEMAESGELTEIIAEYLSLAALFCYDTIADMAASENLDNGSSVYCLGKDTYNDGKGAFYKIREITSGDTVDGYNIVTITNNVNLIGERLPNYDINEINSSLTLIGTSIGNIEGDIDTINNTTIPTIQGSINTINNTTIPGIQDEIDGITETTIPGIQDDITGIQEDLEEITKQGVMLVIGDSFSTNTSGTPLWHSYIADWHNLTVYTHAEDGTGYGTGTNTFLNQLQTANNDTTLNNDDVKEIYIVGGLNDIGNASLTSENFATAVANTINYAETNFTKALIYVIGIFPFQWYNFYSGNACLTDNLRAASLQAYLSYTCLSNANTDRVIFKNSEYFGLTQPGFFGSANASNQKHPSALGEKYIANFIENGETKFGFDDGYATNSDIKSTPLVCNNGNASIQKVDQYGIGIMIENYNSSNGLQLSLTGLPSIYQYLPVSDQQGHSCFMWRDHSAHYYQLFPGNGNLASGTIYVTMPWKLC